MAPVDPLVDRWIQEARTDPESFWAKAADQLPCLPNGTASSIGQVPLFNGSPVRTPTYLTTVSTTTSNRVGANRLPSFMQMNEASASFFPTVNCIEM